MGRRSRVRTPYPLAPAPLAPRAPSRDRRELIEMTPLELWDHIEKPVVPGPNQFTPSGGSEDRPNTWNGGITWAQAKDYARNGWPEGLARIAPVLARVDDMVARVMPEPRIAYDVVGDAPDVGAFLAGIPENMLTTEIGEGSARMVRILVNLGAAAVEPDAIEARGIIACALVDALERVGYRCEVAAVWSARAWGDPRPGATGSLFYSFRTVLKQAEESLSLDRLTFALIHPAFFRRVMFRAMEMIPDVADRDKFVYGGYGAPAPVMGEAGDVIVTEMNSGEGHWTPETLAREVGKYLDEVGVHLDKVPS